MANRRFGGPQRGNRGYSQNNVNPWQGGSAPTGPMPNNNIQAQLAIALSSLLQPKQQMNDNPPSLLSLNPSQGYFNDGYGSGGRYGGGGGRGRDMRRPEPYNKNRGGNWRDNKGGKGFSARNTPRFNKDKKDNKNDQKKKEEKPDSNEEGREDGQEEKRDWKNEKGEDAMDTTEEGKEGGEKGEKKDRSKFANLPPSLLHCFICNKSMWDGESFQNHIGGTAHVQMLNSAEESFRIVVNILRENMRLAEEKEMIELNRMVRSNRKYVHKMKEPQSHCNMCDMKFLGKIIAHRKTAGHQRLKRYLHPKCDICALEFPSRIEWVEHRFTPEHLFKLKEVMENKAGGADGNIIEENIEIELEPLLEESLQSECENPVTELDEPLDNLQNRIPAYKRSREVGTKSLISAEGFICELCHRFFETEELSKAHLKTEAHYHAFLTAVKRKAKRAAAEKEKDDDGNWKRRKTENGEEDASGEKGDDTKTEGTEGDADMYDPEEACNEGNEESTAQEGAKEEPKDDKWAEVDAIIEGGDEEVKDEEEQEEESKSPTRRGQRGGVKNGAGPKSRTRARK